MDFDDRPYLLDRPRRRIRFADYRYSISTEQAYLNWIRRCIRFHGKPRSHPCGTCTEVPKLECKCQSIDEGRKAMANTCLHFDQIREVTPSANGCEDCLRIGDAWNELRVCLTCGHVGCCDDSKNRHATQHFHETNHPLIRSFQPDETWGWCYIDKRYFESMPSFPKRNLWSRLGSVFRRGPAEGP